MAVSSTVDIEGIGKQGSLWTIWRLTPGVFEREAKDKAVQEAQQIALQVAEQMVKQKDSRNLTPHNTKQAVARGNESVDAWKEERAAAVKVIFTYWDPSCSTPRSSGL